MKEGRLEEVYWEKIENKEYPFSQVADELVKMLLEESLNSKYSNYKKDFQRSITLNELRRKLGMRGVKIPSPIELGRTVQSFLNNNNLKYEHQGRGSNGTVYRGITYSPKKLSELMKIMIGIMGKDSVLYEKVPLTS